MGRTLQKKKNKSGIAKVTRKPKSKKSLLLANQIIASSWNKKETLAQNYRRLGLASRLNGHTGGVDRHALPGEGRDVSTAGALDVKRNKQPAQILTTEVRIQRDPKTGAILRVFDEEDKEDEEGSDNEGQGVKNVRKAFGGLVRDPLAKFDGAAEREGDLMRLLAEGHVGGMAGADDDEEQEEQGAGEGQELDFLRQLERDAAKPGGKKPRKQSGREEEWCSRLVERHGRDWSRMARDAELNVMQQSEGDLRRRVEKWLKKRGVAEALEG